MYRFVGSMIVLFCLFSLLKLHTITCVHSVEGKWRCDDSDDVHSQFHHNSQSSAPLNSAFVFASQSVLLGQQSYSFFLIPFRCSWLKNVWLFYVLSAVCAVFILVMMMALHSKHMSIYPCGNDKYAKMGFSCSFRESSAAHKHIFIPGWIWMQVE